MSDTRTLVGDIGGTNIRFAIAEFYDTRWMITRRSDVESKTSTFEDILRGYLDKLGREKIPARISIAVAGPVIDGRAVLTNRNWTVSEDDLVRFGFKHALVMNDFAALAYSATQLQPSNLYTIGPEIAGIRNQPISIIGAGTGLGLSSLTWDGARRVPIATEGGHIGFSPSDEKEAAVQRILSRRFGRVSVERILSGPGIENVFFALHELAGTKPEPIDAGTIMERAQTGEPISLDTQRFFCAVYGAFAGDIALAHGARGGIFIAGGIAQKLKDVLAKSEFRDRFDDKGRLSHFVRSIPTRIILDDDATMAGAAIAMQDNKN
jgi:glucokinase